MELEQYITEQFAMIHHQLEAINAKIEASMTDRITLKTTVDMLDKKLDTHMVDNMDSIKRIWERLNKDEATRLWSKIPSIILQWAIPIAMLALMWAFTHGFKIGE